MVRPYQGASAKESRDGIFRDSSAEELAAQMLVLEGDALGGYRATGRVGVVV
jgi:hypothetical protein